MPPKRKTVKKTVRKTKPKTRTQSPPPPLSPIEPEPESSPPTATAAPSTADTDTETPVSDATTAPSEAAVPGETLAEEPAPAETLEGGTEPTATTNETLEKDIETLRPEASAPNETLETLLASTGSETLAATETAQESEGIAKKPKKVTRVVKVVKKKIVKKLVPKTPRVVQEVEKAEQDEGMLDSNEQQQEIEIPSSDDAPVAVEQKTPEKVEEAEKIEEAVKKLVPRTPKVVQEAKNVKQGEGMLNSNEQQREIENHSSDDAPVAMEQIFDQLIRKTLEKVEEEEEEEAVALGSNEDQREIKNSSSNDAPAPMEEVEKSMKEGEKGEDLKMEVTGDEEAGVLERNSRKKTEIFIGGLDRDAKEEDLRKVFGKAGEIVEVRMIMEGQSGKNKGYAFIRYADASQAKKAVAQFEKVEVCGKLCGASALKGNDTIFLGNIDKKWKKEDIIKRLQEIGIEKIENVNVMPDLANANSNRGFTFLELETNKDAHNAYKKLQKKDVFGKGLNVKVSWAEPLNDPNDDEVKKVKSVYVEGVPDSWNEENLRESFKRFGDIERIVLSRNIKSAKKKDFAFVNYKTREAALSCIESFDKELTDNSSKVNVKVSLAKPAHKVNQNRGGPVFTNKDSMKEKPKAFQRDARPSVSSSMGKSSRGGLTSSHNTRPSTTHDGLHGWREQATWKHGVGGYAGGPTNYDYREAGVGGKRPFSSLGDNPLYSDYRGYPRARLDSYPSTGSSYGVMPYNMAGSSYPYYQHQEAGYAAAARHGAGDYPATHQMRPGAPPYGSSHHPRY